MGILWIFGGEYVLREWLHQDPDVARLAADYLRVLFWGMPGYALFEGLKRFLQCQGKFYAGTISLIVAAPFNMLLSYIFVVTLDYGYKGAPAASAISFWVMSLCALLYIWFIGGKEGWNGFTRDAFHGWGPMCRFASAGVLMICSEWGAFEVIGLAASQLGTDALAANSVLNTICATTYQAP